MASAFNRGPSDGSTSPRVASATQPPDGWKLFTRYEAELRHLVTYYASRDTGLVGWDADDILQEFAVRLGLRRWSAPLINEAAFVRASFRNFLRDWRTSRVREAKAMTELLRLVPEPAELPTAEQTLPAVVAALPQPEGMAAALYLGLGGAARSVREIAEKLGVTRYAARRAVIDGLLAAATALGHEGRLHRTELEAVRLVLLDGLTANQAANSLKISESLVTQALSRARDVVGASFSKQRISR